MFQEETILSLLLKPQSVTTIECLVFQNCLYQSSVKSSCTKPKLTSPTHVSSFSLPLFLSRTQLNASFSISCQNNTYNRATRLSYTLFFKFYLIDLPRTYMSLPRQPSRSCIKIGRSLLRHFVS